MRTATLLALCLLMLVGCGSTSGDAQSQGPGTQVGGTFANISTAGAVIDAASSAQFGSSADRCIEGTSACETSNWCCDDWKSCVENPSDRYHCGTDYCCVGCGGGASCGAGCCNAGQACVANDGNQPGCTTDFCCETMAPSDLCPAEVAEQCQRGTTCRKNKSARLCPGSTYACYLPTGTIGCPGETLCPNGIEFCPAGDRCSSPPVGSGTVCPVSSSSGNNCCVAADPCHAVGVWELSGPEFAGCSGAAGSCQPAPGYTVSATIDANTAYAGGTWVEGERTFTFTPADCNLHFVLNGTLCGDLPGDFNLSTGKGTSLFGCWNNGTGQCACTVQRPADSCSAEKL